MPEGGFIACFGRFRWRNRWDFKKFFTVENRPKTPAVWNFVNARRRLLIMRSTGVSSCQRNERVWRRKEWLLTTLLSIYGGRVFYLRHVKRQRWLGSFRIRRLPPNNHRNFRQKASAKRQPISNPMLVKTATDKQTNIGQTKPLFQNLYVIFWIIFRKFTATFWIRSENLL